MVKAKIASATWNFNGFSQMSSPRCSRSSASIAASVGGIIKRKTTPAAVKTGSTKSPPIRRSAGSARA